MNSRRIPPPTLPSVMPKDANCCDGSGSCARFSSSRAAIIWPVPASRAPPRSARNSRQRENHMTMMLARMPRTICRTMTVRNEPMPRPSSDRNTARSMMLPMTRDKKITKVLTMPDEGQRHHVTVRYVGHLVSENGLNLLPVHSLEEAATHRHQGGVAARAGGGRVMLGRLENADLRHADSHRTGVMLHDRQQPLLGGIGGAVDDAYAHRHLRHGLRHGERDERATEANERCEHQQPAETAAVHGEPGVESR